MNYNDIAEHIDAGKTPAEIATLLAAETRHKRDVSTPDLLNFLINDAKVLTVDGREVNGPLKDAVNASGNQALIEGLKQLESNIWLRPQATIRTSSVPDYGALASGMTAVAKAARPAEAAAIQTGMDALTGGPKWTGVDTSESRIQSLIDSREKEVALEAFSDRCNVAREASQEEYRQADSTPASIVAAGEGAF
jgi:hypothetical protein